MAVHVLDAAHHLCKQSGWTLTQIELQKLLYIAHMIHLGTYHKPLVRGDFEAWEFGPVHRVLYKAVRIYGSRTITRIGRNRSELPDCSERKILDATYEKIGLLSASRLIGITHWRRGAWAKNYIFGALGVIIPEKDIMEEFKCRMELSKGYNGG